MTSYVIFSDNRTKKRRLRYGSDNEANNDTKEVDDLCSDYGKTIAHQLRQIGNRKRDLIRLQVYHKRFISLLTCNRKTQKGKISHKFRPIFKVKIYFNCQFESKCTTIKLPITIMIARFHCEISVTRYIALFVLGISLKLPNKQLGLRTVLLNN